MELKRPVFLIGFMGAGKTTLGKKLAKLLHCPHTDTDTLVCAQNGFTDVAGYVLANGIEKFREAEKYALRSIAVNSLQVVSCGGGTPCFFDNMQWMNNNGITVYIKLDAQTLFNRIKQTNLDERPLLKGMDSDGLKNYIHQTLNEREPCYGQATIIYNPLQEDLQALLGRLKHLV